MNIQQEMLAEMKLKVGDKVRVLCRAQFLQFGWEAHWTSEMDKFIGKTHKVSRIPAVRYGITLNNDEGDEYNFPSFVLEIVERYTPAIPVKISKDYVAQVHKDKIVVGCQTVTKKDFKSLVAAAKTQGLID